MSVDHVSASSPFTRPSGIGPNLCVRRRALAVLVPLGLAATAIAGRAESASAQPITLPTVRIGGPTQEERAFFRILQVVRPRLAPDTARLAADTLRVATSKETVVRDLLPMARQALLHGDTLTRRFGPKLHQLVLAAIDPDQRRALELIAWDPPRPGTADSADAKAARDRRAATLVALASDKYDTTDVPVHALYDALVWYAASDSASRRPRHPDGPLKDHLLPPHVRERDPGRIMRSARELPWLTPVEIGNIDDLTQLAVALVIFRKIEDRRGWFPVGDRAQAEIFWGQRGFAPLNVGAVAVNPSGGVAYTELAAPMLQSFRLSLSAVVTQGSVDSTFGLTGQALRDAQDRSHRAALQRFLTGGGLVNLAAAYPITHHGPHQAREIAVTSLFVPRLGFTAPKLGTGQDTSTLVFDPGFELHGKVLDLAGAVGVTGQLRYGVAIGTRGWGRTVGLAHDKTGYATAGFGFVFASQYQLTFARPIAGPKPMRNPQWTVGLTAVRLPPVGAGVLLGGNRNDLSP